MSSLKKLLLKTLREPFMVTDLHLQGIILRALWKNIRHNMVEQEYLIVESACEVKERGTREKINDSEIRSMGDN